MLERDRRRRERARHAQKQMRKQWLENCEKWARCPNHGQDLAENELLGNGLMEITHTNRLFCPSCRSLFIIGTDVRHP